MLQDLLRKPLPQEVVALLEKIDSLDSQHDSSYHRAWVLVTDKHSKFTWYERKLLLNALGKIARRETLNVAMQVVINAPQEESVVQSSVWVSEGLRAPAPSAPSWGDLFREYCNEKRSMARNDRRLKHELVNAQSARLHEEVKKMQLENRLLEEQVYKETGPKVSGQAQQVRVSTTGTTFMQR